ncbi:GFA family protein [Alteromonas sp. ASW11-36]|uniref:GFA family protein n=1 Tax=Alteromonas arenosi TaxID=3055817 RepID=A0ABT7SZ09_9ALTE|nr:GFA family protein [Alteromonas sp. ASW11-36]MDM7861244.1 GFA family protein [Alteromonas sp. ASW11-36]
MRYTGGCHCGKVRFSVELPDEIEVEDCNCSVCSKFGFLHVIVPKSAFTLLDGDNELTEYRFNSGVAKHYFCATCGVKSFYIPRSNPDGVDVNLRCLDNRPPAVRVVPFDGQNWEQNAHTLAHKSA